MPPSAGNRAYTLYELMMTLSMLTLVLTLGIPTFGDMLVNNRLRVETDRLFHAIHLARKESVTRRRVMTICPASEDHQCLPDRNWSDYWMLFVNVDRDEPAHRDSNEPIVRFEAVDPSVRIIANRDSFSLRSTELRATNGTFIVCSRSGRGTPRALVVSYTGRPRVAYEDSRGQPYDCQH